MIDALIPFLIIKTYDPIHLDYVKILLIEILPIQGTISNHKNRKNKKL
mgnify:CR=1 FL=1